MQLLRADGSEEDLIAACLFEASDLPEEELREAAARLEPDERARLIADLTGTRANRRHKPGRGFEALRYRFEIVSDYGAFRDLQRHRLLTASGSGSAATSAPTCPRRSRPPATATPIARGSR